MKTIRLLLFLIFITPFYVIAQSMVNSGAAITIKNGSAIKISGDYINQQDGRIKNAGTLNLDGNWIQNSVDLVFLQALGGLVKLSGPTSHIVGGSNPSVFLSLKIETEVSLNKITVVAENLDISMGMLNLLDNDLIMIGGSTITGASQNNYITTNGNGIINQVVDGTSVLFPVGTNMNYTPVTISNNANSDEFAVRVFDNVLDNGLSGGQVSNYEETVKHSWVIDDGNDTNISIDYDAQFEWPGMMEGTAFDRNNCAVIHHDETSWQMDASTSATGSDPFSIEKSNIDSYGAFSVQSGGANVPMIHYVTQTGAGTMDGSSWANASPSLQDMMNIAADGEQVWVAAGMYFPESILGPNSSDRYKAFLPKDNISIYGGFAGNEDPLIFDLAQRDFIINETILSGDVGVLGDSLDNCYHVIFMDQISGLVINGFTIEHGRGDNLADEITWSGSGIYSTYSHFDLFNSILRNNVSLSTGSVWALHSTINIFKSSFFNNRAINHDGGGIRAYFTNLNIDECDFIDNYAHDKSGGLDFNYGYLSLTNSIFSGNYGGSGGAIAINSSYGMSLSQCQFINNTAYVGGGALSLGYSLQGASIEDCTFKENSTTYQGGAIDCYHTTIDMNRLTLLNNNGGGGGGAIYYLGNGSCSIINSLIAGNTATIGGGLYFQGNGNFEFANCIITENTATETGGLYIKSSPKIFNTIIWSNSASNGFQVFVTLDSSEPEFHYCDVEGGKDAFGGTGSGIYYNFDYDNANNIDADPNFNNPIVSDYGLLSSSPCINSGVPMGTSGSSFPYIETSGNDWIIYYDGGSINLGGYDLALNDRIYDGRVDIGSYEFQELVQHKFIDVQVFLEGPFNGTNMNSDLNTVGLLPLNQPYSTAPWNYAGTESVLSIPNNQIVDWVLVELRDAPDATSANQSSIIDQQAAFLLNDGSIVDLDGTSILSFSHSLIHSLFIVVHHRNHLDIMSAAELMSIGNYYFYDFTTNIMKAYNSGEKLRYGKAVMYGSDVNADGSINTNDILVWQNDVGKGGYLDSDVNLNGQSDNQDKNDLWIPNNGVIGNIPE